MSQIIRAALRSLLRTRSFAITAVLTLALGIGLATAVFTVADALILRGLPVREPDRLVTLWGRTRDNSFPNFPLTLAQTRTFTRDARSIDGAAYFAYEGASPLVVRRGESQLRLRRALVSGNWFTLLGAKAAVGRPLAESDDVVGAPPVAVISDATWTRLFDRDPSVIGQRFTVVEFNTLYTIVGVAAPGLEYPNGADYWAPFVPARLTSETDTNAYTALDLVVRLASSATAERAEQELAAMFARTGTSEWSRGLQAAAQPLERAVLGDTRPAVLAFLLAAAVLLLITCIDVANLLLVRGLGRAREIAVRSALGASRRRVMGQLLAENVLLAIAGGIAGVGVALASIRAFIAFAPTDIPLVGMIALDAKALGGALTITTVALLFFGLAPAFTTSGADTQEVLRSGARPTGNRRGRILRDGLVAAQLALAVVTLSTASLIGRSFLALRNAELAFDPSRVLIAELAIRYDQLPDGARQLGAIRELVRALEATPGIAGVSPVVAVPFSGSSGWDGRPSLDGQSREESQRNPMLNMELVTAQYFPTLGIPVSRGRAFNDDDREGGEPVVMLSESAARRYWPNQNPVGRRLRMGPPSAPLMAVVGIVPDTRYRDLREARATIYFPLSQSIFPPPTTLAIRSMGDPAALVTTVRRVIAETTADVTLAAGQPFESHMARPLAQPRLNALLLGFFAAAALLLAAVGLFGTMTTMVHLRTRELGVRMALGATARDVVTMVLGRGLAIAAAGGAVGVLSALAANRLLASLLYDVRAGDPLTLMGVAGVLIATAVVALLLPARTSARIQPAIALRSE